MKKIVFMTGTFAVLISLTAFAQVPEDNFNRAYVYAEKGFVDDAIREYESALALNPERDLATRIQYNLGQLYQGQKKYQKSAEHFEKASQLQPNTYLIEMGLATTYKEMQEYRKAIEHFQKALAIDPQYKPYIIHYNIGFADNRLGDYNAAVTELKKALMLAIDDPDCLEELAEAYFNLKEYDKTEQCLNKLENLGKTQKDFFLRLQKARENK